MALSWLEDLFSVCGKTVLVTGGSRGIGRAIAEGFTRAGARVYITSRDAKACATTAAELCEDGQCFVLPGNLQTDEGRQRVATVLTERESGLHALINNAGALLAAPFPEYPESGWDKVFDLNVKGQFFLTKALLPLLENTGKLEDPARVISIGSIDGFQVPGHPTYAYSASKAAVYHMARHLARDLAERHITVNVMAPGMYPSKMLRGTLETQGSDAMLTHTPIKRFVCDEDMMGATLFLASPRVRAPISQARSCRWTAARRPRGDRQDDSSDST